MPQHKVRNPTITVQCQRKGASHAIVSLGHWDGRHFDLVPCVHREINAVQIIYCTRGNGSIHQGKPEVVTFKDHPESRHLHDLYGWNLTELAAWVTVKNG